MAKTYTLARVASRRYGKLHLIRPDRKRMVLCRAERNAYCDVQPLPDWGRKTVGQWGDVLYVRLCENCAGIASRPEPTP